MDKKHTWISLEFRLAALLLAVLLLFSTAQAQKSTAQPKKLPSVDKIVENYLKAIGGKKAVASIRDATYEWIIQFNNQPFGTARLQLKAPSSERWEMTFANGQVISAISAKPACGRWSRPEDAHPDWC